MGIKTADDNNVTVIKNNAFNNFQTCDEIELYFKTNTTDIEIAEDAFHGIKQGNIEFFCQRRKIMNFILSILYLTYAVLLEFSKLISMEYNALDYYKILVADS